MALSKITLKLGRKIIELTNDQFEELKADMRELDKQHHYYWNHSPWYNPWYYNQPVVIRDFTTCNLVGSASNFSSSDASKNANNLLIGDMARSANNQSPPAFEGSVVSTY